MRTRAAGGVARSHPNGVVAAAPFRLSFGSGGTDLMPYRERFGGYSLSATIDMRVEVRLQPWDGAAHRVRWMDDASAPIERPFGALEIARSVLCLSGGAEPLDLELRCAGLFGAGLGSSSATVVTVLAAVDACPGRAIDPSDIASRAYRMERHMLGQAGGAQDHYAAAFGGLNFIEFCAQGARVHPLDLPGTSLDRLRDWLVLCDTGARRQSGAIVRRQIEALDGGDPSTAERMHRMRALTIELRDALVAEDMEAFGRLMLLGWQEKRMIVDGISTPRLDAMCDDALAAGALGVRLVGAGGGGSLLAVVPPDRRAAVESALTRIGGSVTPFRFVRGGVSVEARP